MWTKFIKPTEYTKASRPNWPFSDTAQFALNAVYDMNEVFDRFSDQLPEGRRKIVHKRSAIAKAKWIPTAGNTYTGMFEGADFGFARLSYAAPPSDAATAPGISIKFMRDGTYSGNLISMWSLDGQPSHNFFKNQFKNYVSPPSSKIVNAFASMFFGKAATMTTEIDTDIFADATQNGQVVSSIRSPIQLFFEPHSDVKSLFSDAPGRDFRDDLASLPAGTRLYEVYATAKECRCASSNPNAKIPGVGPCDSYKDCQPSAGVTHIATLVTDSEFVASAYSDDKMFFQHSRAPGAKKQQTLCKGAALAADSNFRLSGDISTQCVNGASCPSGASVVPTGCPFEKIWRKDQ